ncbi:hypothetical protein [Azospirillum picis]|uniref:Uncharacterized protein n=1 Tax=Azospirillum picis TaxID=488438 RepID=A0ABU0MUG1_9PROT|nr:hypothetical protein [Azospirillum picis]MBP2303327.1 hypothetical protein [Azospirillum picis]MDQ0537133.1 hypothetical protein [Azospirillum picis]
MHPAHLVGPEEEALLELWMAWRGRRGVVAGMGSVADLPGHPTLPFAGGLYDQPAIVLAALDIMDAAERSIPSGDLGEF